VKRLILVHGFRKVSEAAARLLQTRLSETSSGPPTILSVESDRRPTPDRRRAGQPRRARLAYVVDDDPAALALMCEIAEDAGWSCRGFSRLGELRAGMRDERPDVLILDDDLPDGSGGDLARDLRQNPTTSRLPVVVCTGAHPIRRAEITSWAPVVAKPFRIEELERFLDAARRRAGETSDHRAAG
jgi:CheY-like chemotaxis protein